MATKIPNEILSTKEYDQFSSLKGNRKVDSKHVNHLIESMKTEYYISPIQVNEKMEVIDGQHRLQAARALKYPVYYYIAKGTNLKTVQTLNTNSKDWKTEDYLQSYIEQVVKDYIIYKQFSDVYQFSHKVNLALLTGQIGSADQLKQFEYGEFKIKDIVKATEVAAKITQVEPHYKGYKRRNFTYAIIRCLKKKEFNWERFMQKVAYQSRKMVDCSNVEQYLELIEEVYNYKTSTDNKLSLRSIK